MSYNFLTQWDSPSYTPASETHLVWGRGRSIEKIAIHWWNDPATNPTFEGVIATLTRPNGVSAHFVATGTGRRVACLVAPEDNSWATASANPYTISIECDPRCRDEDYDVVGELVAELRATYGNLPLMKHSDVVATRCPGSYDLARIDAVAATKIARREDQFGLAQNKTPQPIHRNATDDEIKAAYLEILERPVDPNGLAHYRQYSIAFVRDDLKKSTEYSMLINRKAAEQAEAIRKAAEAEAKRKLDEETAAREAKRIADEKAAQEEAKRLAEEQAKLITPIDLENNAMLKEILKYVKTIWSLVLNLFKRK